MDTSTRERRQNWLLLRRLTFHTHNNSHKLRSSFILPTSIAFLTLESSLECWKKHKNRAEFVVTTLIPDLDFYSKTSPCIFVITMPSSSQQNAAQNVASTLDTDEAKKQKGPASRSYKLPIMMLCAVVGYAICQLDLTLGTNPSMPAIRGFTTTNYMNNGNGKKPILQISVLGERNSGTRWTWGYVQEIRSSQFGVLY